MNFSPIAKNREFINAITPKLRYNIGEDVFTWQVSAQEKLRELLGLDVIAPTSFNVTVENTVENSEYKEVIFLVETEKDYLVRSTLRIPSDKVGKKIPLVIYPVGNTIDRDTALLSGNEKGFAFATRAISEGYAFLMIEQRNFDDCLSMTNIIGESIPRRKGWGYEFNDRTTWVACFRSSMRADMLGKTTIGERVWDAIHVVDAVLNNYQEIDENKICLIGVNGGATLGYYLACLDKRITMLVTSAGISSWNSSIMAENNCVCNYIPYIANYFDMGDIGGMIAPRKFVMMAAKSDVKYPFDGAKSSYELINRVYSSMGADTCVFIATEESGVFYSDIAWDEIHKTLD